MEWNDASIAGGFGPIEAEGRLREHSYFAGRRWDRVCYSISRNNWDNHAGPWRDRRGEVLAPLFGPIHRNDALLTMSGAGSSDRCVVGLVGAEVVEALVVDDRGDAADVWAWSG